MPTTSLYTDLSHYYDLMCAEVEYLDQCQHAERCHQLFGNKAKRYLDLACGTGPHVDYFCQRDFIATGLDINEPMLALARARCSKAAFSLQDMTCFEFAENFDLITCFLYSLHYCTTSTQFLQSLKRAYAALSPGGLLYFDAVDKNAIANDAGYKHQTAHASGDFQFHSRWFFDADQDTLDLHLQIDRDFQGTHQTWRDQHRMLAISVADASTYVRQVGFELTLLNRDFSRITEWSGDSGNVIFICVKPASAV